jgi:hypothetical protein
MHCAYCKKDLLGEHIPAHRAHTEHLLSQKKYPQLRDHSMTNAVASCDVCNCLKGDWDPNKHDPVYFGGELSYKTTVLVIRIDR